MVRCDDFCTSSLSDAQLGHLALRRKSMDDFEDLRIHYLEHWHPSSRFADLPWFMLLSRNRRVENGLMSYESEALFSYHHH